MTRALVLSGGGAKGAYQVGALKKWLLEDGIEYDAFCGISVGSLNSAFLSQFGPGTQAEAWLSLKDVWDRVGPSNVKKSWRFFGVLASLWKPSVYDSSPLQAWVTSELDAKKVSSSTKLLRVVAVSWNTAKPHVATERDANIAQWVIASSSYPVMFKHADIDGEQWTDGGLRSVTPLGEAIRLGADEIDVIMCSNPEYYDAFKPDMHAIPGRLMAALDVFVSQIEIADLKICGYKNDLAELRPEYRKVKIRVLRPEVSIGSSLDFSQASVQRMLQKGYEDAYSLRE